MTSHQYAMCVVPSREHSHLLAASAAKLGYDCIIFTQSCLGKLGPQNSCNIRLPDASSLSHLSQNQLLRVQSLSSLSSASSTSSTTSLQAPLSSSLTQYTRLDWTINDISQVNQLTLTNPTLSTFDVIAVQPLGDEKLFHAVCSSDSVDIIRLPMCQRLEFNLKLPPINMAIENGIMFEIDIAPAIRGRRSIH